MHMELEKLISFMIHRSLNSHYNFLLHMLNMIFHSLSLQSRYSLLQLFGFVIAYFVTKRLLSAVRYATIKNRCHQFLLHT